MGKFLRNSAPRALRIAQRWRHKSLILMYHRVAQPSLDPWALHVSPANFSQQLEVLRERYRVISLHELGEAVRSGCVPDGAVAISFDDGYADNYLNAMPLLERAGLEATVFVTSGAVGAAREFWWDELQRIVLESGELPESLSLEIQSEVREWKVSAEPGSEYSASVRAWEGSEGSRMALYHQLWETMFPLPSEVQQDLLNQLRSNTGCSSTVRSSHRTLTVEELMSLSECDLVEIGAHTATHPSLPNFSAAEQRVEIESGKQRLEDMLSTRVRCFAYPFGSLDRISRRLVVDTGFSCACSTVAHKVRSWSDPFRLPRIAVEDWNGDEFEQRLAHYLG